MEHSIARPSWGKFKSSACFHCLEHHCADVAACFQTLLTDPVLRNRFEQAAGQGRLDRVTETRLAVLAFLHDFGKLNAGFQFKVHDRAGLPPGVPPRAGHVAEALLCFYQEPVCEAIGLYTMCDAWGAGFELLLLASLAHHGRPADPRHRSGAGPPALWKPYSGYDPLAAAKLLGERVRRWFPDAFIEGPPLPCSSAFAHLFAGTVALADQVGSDETQFRYVSEPDPNYIERAWRRAERAVEARRRRRAAAVRLQPGGQLLAGTALGRQPVAGELAGVAHAADAAGSRQLGRKAAHRASLGLRLQRAGRKGRLRAAGRSPRCAAPRGGLGGADGRREQSSSRRTS